MNRLGIDVRASIGALVLGAFAFVAIVGFLLAFGDTITGMFD